MAKTPRPMKPWRNQERWRHSNLEIVYDRQSDMLYAHALPVEAAGGVYVDQNQDAMLLITDKEEIVGFQIENFRVSFLKRHPEQAPAFRHVVRPSLLPWRQQPYRIPPEMVQAVTHDTGVLAALFPAFPNSQ